MALGTKVADAPAAAANLEAAFEAMDEQTSGQASVDTSNDTPTDTAETAPSTSTAVAAAPVNAVSTAVKKRIGPAYEDFRNVIDPASMEFNTFPRITVGLDGFSDDNKKELGKKIKIQLLSFNDRYVCSPGVMNAETTELVKFSTDGKSIDGTGQDCMEYIKQLRDVDGYTDASLKHYMTVYGLLTFANDKELPVEDQGVVGVQVPPQSRAFFTRLQVDTGIKLAQRLISEAPETLVLTQEKADGKNAKYANIKFSLK